MSFDKLPNGTEVVYFQLVVAADGTRSPAMPVERSKFLDAIFAMIPPEKMRDYFIVVLAEAVVGGSFKFSEAPVISVWQYAEIVDPAHGARRLNSEEKF